MYRSTLDIDFYNPAFPHFNHILEHIKKCGDCVMILYRFSASLNGYHVLMFCRKDCWKCRFAFDDQTRVYADIINRKKEYQNVLWNTKYYHKAGNNLKMEASEWKLYYMNASREELRYVKEILELLKLGGSK